LEWGVAPFPFILSHGTRRRVSGHFHTWPLYSWAQYLWCLLNRKLGGLQNKFGCSGGEKKFLAAAAASAAAAGKQTMIN